jgi:type IV secretory pathway VirB4 component
MIALRFAQSPHTRDSAFAFNQAIKKLNISISFSNFSILGIDVINSRLASTLIDSRNFTRKAG